jgi:hypothetical protein
VPSLYLSGNLLLHSPEASYGDHDDSAQPDVGLDLALGPVRKVERESRDNKNRADKAE